MLDELREGIQKGARLSVISACFTIYAYEALKKELSQVEEVRFIFTTPSFIKKREELQREFYITHSAEIPSGARDMLGSRFELKLRNKLTQSAIARECAEWLRKKVRVKSLVQPNAAQPRMICIENKDPEASEAVNGTVDFSSDGLGLTPSDRADMNQCVYGAAMTRGFLQMFDSFWNNTGFVEDVTDRVLQEMQVLYKENTPELIYFLTLYHIFEAYLDELDEEKMLRTKTGFKDSAVWKALYRFQKDGVIGAIDKIEKYGGCIIADSVGLGKTMEALAVIKYYELRNDRVLVLTPKKLRDNWTMYLLNDRRNPFAGDRFSFDVLNHTDLTRSHGKSGEINLATLNWGNYDLVVIDESHNFRNNPPVKGRKTRYQKLMEDIIQSGIRTRVLMLSATPVNNRMNDIKNQIHFITEGDPAALRPVGIVNIDSVLRNAQKIFNRWSKEPENRRTTDNFVSMMDMDYFRLLDTLTIARSRKHIEKYYDTKEIGEFPKRLPPVNEYPGIDRAGEFPPIGRVNRMILQLTLALYAPLRYVLPARRLAYERKYNMEVAGGKSIFRQADREKQVVGLIRVNILKRLESSIHSFTLTLERLTGGIRAALDKIKQQADSCDPLLDIEKLDLDDSDLTDIAAGNKVKVLLQDMDLIKWKQDLTEDLDALQRILGEARKITADRDQKLETLRQVIQKKWDHPINEGNRKILIFTAFADTAAYLYEHLAPELKEKGADTALIMGGGAGKTTLQPRMTWENFKPSDIACLLPLFSPKSNHGEALYPGMGRGIDVLISTDCISEGQNLQDCDCVINYDIHWNPVRIIQRFGRIDRIGSRNTQIQLINFWPTKDLDEYIDLAERVRGWMVLLDVSATGEENLIAGSEEEMNDLEYRKKQLQRLQGEVVDLEEINGAISITDLTFNDFKIDLMEYMKKHRDRLAAAPTGLYAVSRIPENFRDTVEPGVIFTLRQVKGKKLTLEQNPLFPYYLVYITERGEVKLNFARAKKVMDYLKKFGGGEKKVHKDLVAAFNEETKEGRSMGTYSSLLQKAIGDLIGEKEEAGADSLFSMGGTQMPGDLGDGMEDFELVSFLILK